RAVDLLAEASFPRVGHAAGPDTNVHEDAGVGHTHVQASAARRCRAPALGAGPLPGLELGLDNCVGAADPMPSEVTAGVPVQSQPTRGAAAAATDSAWRWLTVCLVCVDTAGLLLGFALAYEFRFELG